jgi:hypothetical protein
MTLDEAKEKFKAGYARPWFELVDEHAEELFFRTRGGTVIKVSSADLNNYVEFSNRREIFENRPFESCLCSPTYFEQNIASANRFAVPLAVRIGEKITFGQEGKDQITVEIGEASSDFKNYFRFHEYWVMRTHDRLRTSRLMHANGRDLRDYLFMPTTIKVFGLNEANAENAAKKAAELVEGCLFNLSYLKGVALGLEEEWPKRQALGDGFRYEEREIGSQLPLPKSKINRDVARFYQRGMAADDPANQFLSFYQVLEYFFLSVSDEELYRKLSGILHDPMFSTKTRHLDKLIQATLSHKRESDETEMLRLVLVKHVDEADLIPFIHAYEKHLADKWFTKKRKLFGEENEVKAIDGHVIGNVAKRVKLIRNALVHSSDRYNRQENFIPTRAAETEIRKEVPLVKFLAEKVIIGSFT